MSAVAFTDEKYTDVAMQAVIDAVHEALRLGERACGPMQEAHKWTPREMEDLSIWLCRLRSLTGVLEELNPPGWNE